MWANSPWVSLAYLPLKILWTHKRWILVGQGIATLFALPRKSSQWWLQADRPTCRETFLRQVADCRHQCSSKSQRFHLHRKRSVRVRLAHVSSLSALPWALLWVDSLDVYGLLSMSQVGMSGRSMRTLWRLDTHRHPNIHNEGSYNKPAPIFVSGCTLVRNVVDIFDRNINENSLWVTKRNQE